MIDGWTELHLQDVVSILGDGLHGTPKYNDNGQYYFINGNNLSDGKIVIKKDTKKTTYVEYLKYNKNLNDRTILLSINGTIGNIAFYNGEKCVLGKSACYFNVLDTVNKVFIHYVVSNNHFQKYIKIFAHGTTIKNVSLKTVREYPFLLPPLTEQKSIAAVLSSLDNKIENQRQQNQTLEKIAKTLFKYWFVDFEFPNKQGKPYKSSGGKMIDSELGPIPQGWRVVNESNEINIAYGKNLPTKNLLNEGYTVFGANGLIGYFESYHYEYPQVLISCRGEASGTDNFTLPYSFVTNNSLVLEIKQDSQLSYVYLKYYCLKHNFLPYVTGTAQPQITIESLRSFLILMPCNQILSLFNILAKSIENKMSLNNNQIKTITKIRDTLLPKLMSGEIRIPLEDSWLTNQSMNGKNKTFKT